jgi:hypothetical protein
MEKLGMNARAQSVTLVPIAPWFISAAQRMKCARPKEGRPGGPDEKEKCNGLYCPKAERPKVSRERISTFIGQLQGIKDDLHKAGLHDAGDTLNAAQTLLEAHHKKAPKAENKPPIVKDGVTFYWCPQFETYVTIPEE